MAMVRYWRREIGPRAFLDGAGDVLHPLVAGGRVQHLHAGDDAVEHGDQAADDGDDKQVHGYRLPCSLGKGAAEERRPP